VFQKNVLKLFDQKVANFDREKDDKRTKVGLSSFILIIQPKRAEFGGFSLILLIFVRFSPYSRSKLAKIWSKSFKTFFWNTYPRWKVSRSTSKSSVDAIIAIGGDFGWKSERCPIYWHLKKKKLPTRFKEFKNLYILKCTQCLGFAKLRICRCHVSNHSNVSSDLELCNIK